MLQLLIVVSIVILTSATCSLFEAVLYAVPLSRIEQLVSENRATGRILRKLRDQVDTPIAAILTLNTIANTAGAAVAGAIASKLFGASVLVYFSVIFTFLILFFSEIIPKTIGVVYCRSLAPTIAYPLQAIVWTLKPVIILCSLVTRMVSGKRSGDSISEEELIVMARLGKITGVIDEDEASVIQNILSLETKTVHDVMTPRTVLFTLDGTLSVHEANKDRRIYSHSRIPIYLETFENIVGIVHRHDVVAAVAEDKFDLKLETLMKPADFVSESTKLNKVLKNFIEQRRQLFVVIGEYGGLSGVITLEDVLEEILGKEIVDEFDRITDLQSLAKRKREKLLQK